MQTTTITTTTEEALLSVEQVAKRLNVSASAVWKWRRVLPEFPKGVLVGSLRRWNSKEVEAYLQRISSPTPTQ